MTTFISFDQVGDNSVRDDLVEISVMDLGSAGYWLRAARKNCAGILISDSITFVPEIFDKLLKFVDIIEDGGIILAGAKTELGRIGILRNPKKGTVDIYYAAFIKNRGSICIGSNVTETEITEVNKFVDLNLEGVVKSSANFLWSLIDPKLGELQYNGVESGRLGVRGILAAYSSGGIQRFNFRLLKNGLPLEPPDNIDIPLEIRTTIGSSPLFWYVFVMPGDKIKLQVENADGVSNIVIDTLKISIS